MARFGREERTRKSERRRKINVIIMGIILLGLMVVGMFSITSDSNSISNPNKFEYNGFIFEIRSSNSGIFYVAKQNGVEKGVFYNSPMDTENLSVSKNFKNSIRSASQIVVTSEVFLDNENSDRPFQDYFVSDIASFSGKTVTRGYLTKDKYAEFPVYTCEDASEQRPVIVINSSVSGTGLGIFDEETQNCYTLHASSIEILKFRDKILYILGGVQE